MFIYTFKIFTCYHCYHCSIHFIAKCQGAKGRFTALIDGAPLSQRDNVRLLRDEPRKTERSSGITTGAAMVETA